MHCCQDNVVLADAGGGQGEGFLGGHVRLSRHPRQQQHCPLSFLRSHLPHHDLCGAVHAPRPWGRFVKSGPKGGAEDAEEVAEGGQELLVHVVVVGGVGPTVPVAAPRPC